MEKETLKLKRGQAFTALVAQKKPGLSTINDVARKLSSDKKTARKVEWRFRNYITTKEREQPRVLMPLDQCVAVARLFDVQPSSLYIELTDEEKKKSKTRGVSEAELVNGAPVRHRQKPRKKSLAPSIGVSVTIPELGVTNRHISDVKVIKHGEGFAVTMTVPVAAEQVLKHLL